jgi:hypothetical protein
MRGNPPTCPIAPMSDSSDTIPSAPATPDREETPPPPLEEMSPLYQSLLEMVKLPSSPTQKWLDNIADFKNNPRALHEPPFNDGALHWVNKDGRILGLGFPAMLDLHGRYGRLSPYFSMAGEQGVNVRLYIHIPRLLTIF